MEIKASKIAPWVALLLFTLPASNVPAKAQAVSGPGTTGCVVLTYDKPVEGFWVEVLWRPHEIIAEHVIGPAILEFKHEDPAKTFFVTNLRFGLPESSAWAKTATIVDGYVTATSQRQAVLDYVEPKITDHLPSTSFFFLDLDFDGEKELVSTEIANGQRWRNTYRVFQPGAVGQRSDEIAARVPFNLLDSATRIDLKERTIRFFNSSGAKEHEELVYKFDAGLNRYLLRKP